MIQRWEKDILKDLLENENQKTKRKQKNKYNIAFEFLCKMDEEMPTKKYEALPEARFMKNYEPNIFFFSILYNEKEPWRPELMV